MCAEGSSSEDIVESGRIAVGSHGGSGNCKRVLRILLRIMDLGMFVRNEQFPNSLPVVKPYYSTSETFLSHWGTGCVPQGRHLVPNAAMKVQTRLKTSSSSAEEQA